MKTRPTLCALTRWSGDMLLRKLIRTIGKYKAQFLSMVVMTALGVGVFVGFHIEWYSLERDGNAFFAQGNEADYSVYDESGFSQTDLEAVQQIEGVEAASRFLTVDTAVKGEKKSLALCVQETPGISDFVVVDQLPGAAYGAASQGMWLSDRFAAANGIALGDTVTVTYQGREISAQVEGLIKSPAFAVCVADENQLMPDYETYGYFYLSPAAFLERTGLCFYPQIQLRTALDKAALEERVNEALGRTTLVLSKEETLSHAALESEMEEGKTMGSILPVLFLLVAALTMITTMHRITVNEKTQIGTLKALGFRDRRILWHYTAFGLVVGLLGTALGAGLGFGIAAYILNADSAMGTYFDLPSWKLYFPWFCWVVLAALIGFLTLLCALSVKRILRGSAAETLRPGGPRRIRRTLLERSLLWQRLSFGSRWNLRDISRHRSRSFVTLFGVVGCMVLLVGGFGMNDTMQEFTDVYYHKVCNYETRINFTEDAPNEAIEAIAAQYEGDWVAVASVQMKGETVSFEVYSADRGRYRFVNEDNECVTLSEDGAYLCQRLKDTAALGETVTLSPYGTDEVYQMEVAGYIRSVMTENVAVTRAYAEQHGIPYHITSVFTNVPREEIADSPYIANKTTREALIDSLDGFMEMLYVCVAVLALFAVLLSLTVLYNLGVMSYVERYRELATPEGGGLPRGAHRSDPHQSESLADAGGNRAGPARRDGRPALSDGRTGRRI